MTFLRRIIVCLLLFLLPLFLFSLDNESELPDIDAAENEYEVIENFNDEPELDIEEIRSRIYGEDPAEFMGFSLKDTEVSLFISGSWKGSLQGNFGLSHSPAGFAFASPETPFLYKQEADLSLSLFINDRWFVEANFLDDSENNTYRAGYQGQKNEFLQYAGIGNTGLDFPSFPYMDLGGDSPSSFGFYSRMGNGGINVHTLFRYDAASREERVFIGSRERTYSYIQVQDTIRGISFVLPDTDIDTNITVYIEDQKGTLFDTGGRRWRLALSGEYAALKTQGLLELSVRAENMIAVSYSKAGQERPWLSSMGDYASSGYLYNVQQWFAGVNLENYPQCGSRDALIKKPGEVIIGNVTALVISENGTFSPFERRSRYDSPSSASEEASLVHISNGTQIGGYELVLLDINSSLSEIPLLFTIAGRRSIYELVSAEENLSRRDVKTIWPLAKGNPRIYLPGNSYNSADMVLRFTNYSGTSGFFIGKDAVPGSVQVWRSGIQDANFVYSSSAGEVVLYAAAGQNEIIRITFLKRSEETQLGSIAAGFGAVYEDKNNPFSAQAALGIRWNLSGDTAFTEEGVLSAGTAGLGVKAAWDFNYLKAQITSGLAFEQTDTTGLYRAAGMEGYESILALPAERAFLSHPPSSIPGLETINRVSLIFRNYFNSAISGSTLMPVSWTESQIIPGLDKPYPVKDPLLGDTQVLAAEFSMNSGQWTGFQVPLAFQKEILARAVEIEIPYRFYGFEGDNTNFELIMQIGSLSPEESAVNENINLIYEKTLFADNSIISSDSAIARFVLNDTDRHRLGDVKFFRIIAVYKGLSSVSGRVLIAPPIVRCAAFRPVTFNGKTISAIPDFSLENQVRAYETIETGADTLESAYGQIVKRLHPADGTQRVLKIEWENMQSGISAGVDGRAGNLPLSDYRELSFFIKKPEIESGILRFFVSGGSDSIDDSILEARLPLNVLKTEKWSKVTIRYQGGDTGVYADGVKVNNAFLKYSPPYKIKSREDRTDYIAVFLESQENWPASGCFYIDEIILEDAVMVYRMNAGGTVEYRRNGTLLSIAGFSLLSDLLLFSALESEFRTGFEPDAGISGSVTSRSSAGISVAGIDITGNLALTAAKDTFIWSADHSISRRIGVFSFKESFFASPLDMTARHLFNMEISSDFYAKFSADAFYDYSRLRRNWNFGIGYKSQNEFIPSVALNAGAVWLSRDKIDENSGYGRLWLDTWKPVIPDSGGMADNRKTLLQFSVTQRSRPVGAVLTMEGGTNFTSANSITGSESSAFLDIPVLLNRYMLNFRMGRSFKKQLDFYGNDVIDDSEKYFESINDSLALCKFFPVYSLFAPNLKNAMNEAASNSPSARITRYMSFNDHLSAQINFPAVYNPASFIIPSRLSFRLERALEQKLDTETDIFYAGLGLGFSSLNMFGALGYLPLFKFYHNDEFSHSLEGTAVFNENNVTWRFQSAAGASFRGFTGGVFSIVNTFNMRNEGYWLENLKVIWTTPTEKSLLSIVYDWAVKAVSGRLPWINFSLFLKDEYDQLRKESLELTFDRTQDYLKWNISAGHESIVRILGRLELTSFIRLRCSEDADTDIFIIDALAGVTLRVSF